MFTPSTYQKNIFDWIDSGQGDAVVNAVAGSGKTTTLLKAAELLHGKRSLFVAFNRLIATELSNKLQQSGASMSASTIHGLGRGCIQSHFGGAPRVVGNKYLMISRSYLKNDFALARNLNKLVGLAQLTLSDPTEENLIKIVNHYDLKEISITDKSWKSIHPLVRIVLEAGVQQAKRERVIDFNDMAWLPIKLNMIVPLQDFIFVDECQDLNAAYLELLLKCRAPGGRFLFVGDRRQSLYGFAGADTESVDNIVNRTNATELPLSICYRCPSSHVLLAKQIVPEIEASPFAETGTIEVVPSEMLAKFNPSSENTIAILSRCTAPLVSACLKMLRAGKKAVVRGKDIGASIIDILDKITIYSESINDLSRSLDKYKSVELARLEAKEDNELAIESLFDRCDTVEALYAGYLGDCEESSVRPTMEGLKTFILDKFDDTVSDDCFIFSTVHKSKGLEFDTICILNPQNKLMPHPAAKKLWQVDQEYNIIYVALTRSKKELYFLDAAIDWLILPEPAIICSSVEAVAETTETETKKEKRGRGRPKKSGDMGQIRDRVNVSLDKDVIRFLRSQKNYSEFLESFVLSLPEFDEFIKAE